MDFPFSACAVMAPNEKCDLEELVELENDIFVVYATFVSVKFTFNSNTLCYKALRIRKVQMETRGRGTIERRAAWSASNPYRSFLKTVQSNSLLDDVFKRIIFEDPRLAHCDKRSAISSREVQMAVILIFLSRSWPTAPGIEVLTKRIHLLQHFFLLVH
ncbi:hypothetical protein Y032_0176g556 [Ancylostoma ceylanicum]|uniref:Uncharacterized protein n=1 Tax=Ancylostoma ceylanicum TaxID=53326 RepID=A0A016SUL7_9BILA|nr:hypothetical protein Y032_0176g556 [Ancylostoma ceylanicum]